MILIILVLLLFAAAVWDFFKGKIPNLLILAGCCYGLVRMIYYHDVLKSVPGIILPAIILFPLYKIGVIGAGDIKLFSMMGFYFSFMETVFCIFSAFMLGAIISLFSFMRYGNFTERMTYLFSYLRECFLAGRFRYYYADSDEKNDIHLEKEKTKIHLAIPIFFSVLLHVGGVL